MVGFAVIACWLKAMLLWLMRSQALKIREMAALRKAIFKYSFI